MLDTFRAMSGGFAAKILLGFLILVFGVWGIGDMLRRPTSSLAVATVGSVTISGSELARALQRDTENMRRALGPNYSPELMKSLNLPQRSLQKLIDHALIRQESEALGLVPGDADVARRIRENPAFQDGKGNFDKGIFEATLRSNGLSEKVYITQLRQDIASNLLVDTLLSAVVVPEAEARALFDRREEQRSVTLYVLGLPLAGAIPQLSEDQIKAYYEAHKQEFMAPEYRAVSYVTLTSADARDNAAISEEALRQAYKEHIDEFKRPERRTVEQLLYGSEDAARKAAALLDKGKSFDQVARETGVKAASLGKIERNSIPENDAAAVFALHIGEHTAPVQSPFGWHIFHLSAVDEPYVASFDEMRPALEKDMKQHAADESLNMLANKLEDALAGGATLGEAAKELKLNVATLAPFNRQGEALSGGKFKNLPELDKFMETAFKTEEKTESPLMASKGGAYYILHVDSVTPERQRPLDEVRSDAVAGWQKDEKQKRLAELAKAIAGKFSDAGARGGVIAQYGLHPAATAPIHRDSDSAGGHALPPPLVADAFARQAGESTGAYPTANGDYMLAVVSSLIPAPAPDKDEKLKAELSDIRRDLETSIKGEIMTQYTHYLAKKYPVVRHENALQAVVK